MVLSKLTNLFGLNNAQFIISEFIVGNKCKAHSGLMVAIYLHANLPRLVTIHLIFCIGISLLFSYQRIYELSFLLADTAIL